MGITLKGDKQCNGRGDGPYIDPYGEQVGPGIRDWRGINFIE